MTTVTPEVTWAQRSSDNEPEKNYVFLTIVAADVPESELKLDLQPTKLSFKGASTSKKVTYAVELEFFAEIDPAESKIQHSGRDVTLVLRKKELKQEFWPRLLKDNKKMHFLKTNFDKWVDEDEQDEAPADDEMMNQMNPMGGAGGGDGGFGGIDFSKLGGAGGPGGMDMASMMGGMGGAGGPGGMDMASMMQSMGAGGMGGMPEGMDDDSDDDDDMPELENDETKPAAAAASGDKPKIEEVA